MNRSRLYSVGLVILLAITSVVSLFIGVIDLNISKVLAGDFEQIELILISRIPRLLAILCVGAGMSVAGLIMQNLTMNKFVSPTTSGTIASAQFGVLIALIAFPMATLSQRTIMAFISAMVGTWIFVWFIQKVKFKDIIMVPLIGIMFGYIINGLIDYFSYKYGVVQAIASWLVGDFSLIVRGKYEIVWICLPLIVLAFIYANHFNIVGMGEDFSKNLGVSYNTILFFGLTLAAMITAAVVVTVGSIPYIGLIIPNLVSMFKGDRIRGSLWTTAIFGALFVLVCDIFGRVVNYPYEIPVNLTIGVIGSIVFIAMLFQRLSPKARARAKKMRGESACAQSLQE